MVQFTEFLLYRVKTTNFRMVPGRLEEETGGKHPREIRRIIGLGLDAGGEVDCLGEETVGLHCVGLRVTDEGLDVLV